MKNLKEFRNIGKQIKIYTDHIYSSYKTFNTERVVQLTLEEYNPEFIYIQGSQNIAADALSRIDMVNTNKPVKPNMLSLAKYFSRKRGCFTSS